MEDPSFALGSQLARRAAEAYDYMIRGILDEALGPGRWAMEDVPQYGQLVIRPDDVTEVRWRGRLLGTIRRVGDPCSSAAELKASVQIRYEVRQVVYRIESDGPL